MAINLDSFFSYLELNETFSAAEIEAFIFDRFEKDKKGEFDAEKARIRALLEEFLVEMRTYEQDLCRAAEDLKVTEALDQALLSNKKEAISLNEKIQQVSRMTTHVLLGQKEIKERSSSLQSRLSDLTCELNQTSGDCKWLRKDFTEKGREAALSIHRAQGQKK